MTQVFFLVWCSYIIYFYNTLCNAGFVWIIFFLPNLLISMALSKLQHAVCIFSVGIIDVSTQLQKWHLLRKFTAKYSCHRMSVILITLKTVLWNNIIELFTLFFCTVLWFNINWIPTTQSLETIRFKPILNAGFY